MREFMKIVIEGEQPPKPVQKKPKYMSFDEQRAWEATLNKGRSKDSPRLIVPNYELPELDINGRFCKQRKAMIAPEDWGKQGKKEAGMTRPFVSWEKQGSAAWHTDEEAVRAEMENLFPHNPLFAKKRQESFVAGQERKVKVIQAWEKYKDEQERQAKLKKSASKAKSPTMSL